MIILTSDYSPKAAAEKQDEDNESMFKALLVIGGLTLEQQQKYTELTNKSQIDYIQALGTSENGIHTEEQWQAATNATKEPLQAAGQILKDARIKVTNKLKKSDNDAVFSHIETTVYKGIKPIAVIRRPVLDKEVETYVDNSMGYLAGESND